MIQITSFRDEGVIFCMASSIDFMDLLAYNCGRDNSK